MSSVIHCLRTKISSTEHFHRCCFCKRFKEKENKIEKLNDVITCWNIGSGERHLAKLTQNIIAIVLERHLKKCVQCLYFLRFFSLWQWKSMLQNNFYRSLLFVSTNWKYHTGGRERLVLYQFCTIICYPHYPHCTCTVEVSSKTKKTSSKLSKDFE